jgi:hypothetical protein
MLLVNRPSKSFVYAALVKLLKERQGGVGVDASSANMKNIWMFKTDIYVAIDIRKEVLQEGIERNRDHACKTIYAICCDLANLDIDVIGQGFADVVLSSHTLYQLDPEPRIAALRHLCSITKPSGLCIIEIPIDQTYDTIRQTLQEFFEDVNPIHYRNPLSRFYENCFRRISASPTAGHPLVRTLFVYPLSRLEAVTSGRRRFWNGSVLFVATRKLQQTKGLLNLKKLRNRNGIHYFEEAIPEPPAVRNVPQRDIP